MNVEVGKFYTDDKNRKVFFKTHYSHNSNGYNYCAFEICGTTKIYDLRDDCAELYLFKEWREPGEENQEASYQDHFNQQLESIAKTTAASYLDLKKEINEIQEFIIKSGAAQKNVTALLDNIILEVRLLANRMTKLEANQVPNKNIQTCIKRIKKRREIERVLNMLKDL